MHKKNTIKKIKKGIEEFNKNNVRKQLRRKWKLRNEAKKRENLRKNINEKEFVPNQSIDVTIAKKYIRSFKKRQLCKTIKW